MTTNIKNILHIAPTPFFSDRGCHIRIEGEVRCLSKAGYANTVCTYHHGRDVANVATKRIKKIQAYTQTAAGPSKYKLLADWRLLWLVFRQYRKLKPISVHAHLHEGLLIGLIVKVLFFWRRTPLIADLQGSLAGELESHGAFEKRPYLKWPVTQLEKILMWCATHIVCSNSHTVEKVINEFGINADKVSLSQDGADPLPKVAEQSVKELLDHYQFDSENNVPLKTIVVYSGALLNSKGLNELKQVILDCSKQSSELHFLIIGYPTENLSPFLDENDLSAHCTLTGQIDFEKLPSYLSIASIAIDPKNSDAGEGSGKMLNYLAAGLPVVAFDSLNNLEFMPVNTELAKSNEDLSRILLKLAQDRDLRAETAAANLKQFEERYSWDITRQQLEAVYAKLLGKSKV